jgi:general secretion pathway protein D
MMGGMGGMMGGMGGMMGGMGGYGTAGMMNPMGYMPQVGNAYPGAGMGGFGGPGIYAPQGAAPGMAGQTGTGGGIAGAGTDQTGQYLSGPAGMGRIPHIIPNPMDNTLLMQTTAQEYQQIMKLLRQIDIPPRQVLLDARIYEVSLTGAFSSGVAAFLQKRGTGSANPGRDLIGSLSGAAVNLSAGMLVGQSRELLAFLQLQENESRARVVSAPSVIATDSLPASINVGLEVPTLASQAVTGVQQGGSSLFANTIQNRATGVTLNVTARINASGIVTLMINQDVSAPQAPSVGSIQSPSFSRRSLNTQVTVQDGDTIAIGGIINESNSMSTAGIPVLHRLPIVGAAFGSRSYSKERTELIIFMTPRVIYDTNQVVEASDEIRSRLRMLNRYVKE